MTDDYLAGMRGTRLSGKQFFNEVLNVSDEPEIEYTWATGVAISKFLAGMKEGKIYGSHCDDCNKTMVPAMMFCYECFNPMSNYVELPDTGIINTFSLAYINTDATRRDTPELPIVVEIDGTTHAPSGFVHLLKEGTDVDKIKVGAKVKAVWKPEKERIGDITDIMYFELKED